jgi:hypothetical protein
MRRLALLLSVVTTLLVAAPAHATAEFPGLIISTLKISCDGGASPLWDQNGCTICHLSNNGGLGTVQHPFGVQMKSLGLSAFNDSALVTTLGQLQDGNTGCNGIEMLETCQWEALAGAQSLSSVPTCGDGGVEIDAGTPEAVIYGCAAAPTTTTHSNESNVVPISVAGVMSGMLALALVRRRRKRA